MTRFGGNLVLDEDFATDVVAAGGQVTVNGNVDGTLIVFGGNVVVAGNVSDSVKAFGGNVELRGDVGGDLQAYGGSLFFDGVVAGDADLGAGDIRMGPEAKITGDLVYDSPQQATDFQDAVAGSITRSEEQPSAAPQQDEGGFSVAWFLHNLLTGAVAGFILLRLLPKWVSRLAKDVRNAPVMAGILGIMAFPIITLLVALGLLAALLGWQFSVALALGSVVVLLFCTIPVKLAVGEVVDERLLNKNLTPWKAYLVGLVLYTVISEIPVLGGIVSFLAVVIGFGAVVRAAIGEKWTQKLPAF